MDFKWSPDVYKHTYLAVVSLEDTSLLEGDLDAVLDLHGLGGRGFHLGLPFFRLHRRFIVNLVKQYLKELEGAHINKDANDDKCR